MTNLDSQPSHTKTAKPYVVELAHDIGNLLLVVNWSSRQLLAQLAEDHPNRSALQAIFDAGTQAAERTRELQQLLDGPGAHAGTDSNAEITIPPLREAAGPSPSTPLLQAIGRTQGSTCNNSSLIRPELFAGAETILLAEDDRLILDLVKRRLEKCGYKVLAAESGSAAIAMALDHTDSIHLLITDQLMPEATGREVAETLREHYPGLPTLFLSGQPIPEEDSPSELDSFLQKPFKSTELLLRVRAIIDSFKK